MTEREKFEAWATLRGFGMKKVPAEGKRYVSDTTQAAWEGYQAAIASQQKPEFIDRDGEYTPPLSDRERATKFGEAIAKGLSQIGKPVPAGLDEVALRVAKEIFAPFHVETEGQDFIDFAHRLIAELTKWQEPAATKKSKGIVLHTGWDDRPDGTKLYAAPIPVVPTGWVGCGECDCAFPCHEGKARCIRLAADTIDALRAKVEELSKDRDYWKEQTHDWYIRESLKRDEEILALEGQHEFNHSRYLNLCRDLAAMTKERDELRNVFLTDSVASLASQLAAMELDRNVYRSTSAGLEDKLHRMTKERDAFRITLEETLKQLAAKDAVIERLKIGMAKHSSAYLGHQEEWEELLNIPNDDSALQERLAHERERCAKQCELNTEGFAATSTWDESALSCAKAIRGMTK